MAIAITGASRLQDLTDVNVTLGAGEDEKVLVYDHDTQRFLLRATAAGVTDHGLLDAASLLDDDHTQYLLATGGRTGASAAAQPFTVGISLTDTTTSTTGVVFKGADRFVHNFHHPTGNTAVPQGRNTFIGVNAGNFTMGSTATDAGHGSNNVGIGYGVQAAVTTGAKNMAIGSNSMRVVSTGYDNVSMGFNSLYNLTTGAQNVAVGSQALANLASSNYNCAVGFQSLYFTTGASNSAFGAYAGYSNTTGANNTFIGSRAGRYHADGATALTDPENSVYIGFDSRGYDNTDSNSIVIGYTAIGLGPNTTVIGNTSTTAATIYGAHLANLTDATTNALVPMLTLTKNVTGAGIGAAGLGPVIVFQAEDSTTDSVQQARIAALWNDATHATRKADLVLTAYDTAEREGLRIRGAGAAAAIGFFGHAPGAQPAAYTPSNVSADRAFDADTVAVAELADVVGTLIADLQSLGLVA